MPEAICDRRRANAVSPGMRTGTALTPRRGVLWRQACASQLASRLKASIPPNAVASMIWIKTGVPPPVGLFARPEPHRPAVSASTIKLKAKRVEIAHAQYYGWALKNRAALMPTREQVDRAIAELEEVRQVHHGHIVIDAVLPDYYARFPKPCVGGWGRRRRCSSLRTGSIATLRDC